MALDRFKKEMGIIAALDDEPNDVGGLSAAELKGKFDEGGIALQKFINETLIPALEELGIETIVKNGGKADTIRVNDEMMLEVSDDGETFVVVGAGHKIVDKDGKELPRRLKLQFVNGDLSTTDQATVVRITPNWTDINGAPFGDVIIYQDSYELSAFPDSAFTATSNTGERFSFHKVSDNALSYKQLSDTTFTLRLADASANAKFDDSSLYQRTRDYTHFYLGAITVGNQTLDNYAYFAAYKAGTITTQDGETIKIPAVGLYIGKEETKSFPFGTWKPNGIQPVAYGLVVSYVCEDVVPIDKKYLPEVFVDGVQPDWNQNDPDALDYVKNRTHWEEVLAEGGTIFPETDVEFKTSMAVLNGIGTEQVSVGQKYIVTWRGTEYECTAFLLFANDPSSVTLGNSSLLFVGNNTGEPFCLSDFTTSNCIVTKDTSTATTIKIKVDEVRNAVVVPIPKKYLPAGVAYTDTAKVGQTIVVKEVDSTGKPTAWEAVDMSAGGGGGSWDDLSAPMPTKFLPDGVPYVEEGGMVEILPDYTITEDNSEADIAAIPALGLVAGATYTVTLNGTEYTCVATLLEEDGLSVVCLGDAYTLTGGQVGTAPTGEPFVLIEYPPELAVELGMNVAVQPLSENITLPITFSIYGGGVTVHKLDNRCLDLAWLPTSELSTVVEETTVEHNTYMGDFGYGQFPVGTEVVVLVDGTPYKTTVQTAGEGTDQYWFAAIGNVVRVTMLLNNSHWSFVDGASHQVEICVEVYNKMPAEFLPKGTPYVQEDVLLAETNAESSEDPTFGQIWLIQGVALNLTAGETYTILYNGTPYKCVCQTAPDGFTNDPDAVAMGNFASIGGEDTGEPFALLSQPNYKAIAIIDFVGSTAVKVGISGEVAQKMDARCLPDDATVFYLTSPNGTKFAVTVDDDGTLTATAV